MCLLFLKVIIVLGVLGGLIFNAVLQEVKDMLTIIEDFEDVECLDEGLFCLF